VSLNANVLVAWNGGVLSEVLAREPANLRDPFGWHIFRPSEKGCGGAGRRHGKALFVRPRNFREKVSDWVATEEQLERITKIPKREFMRRGINQHTLEKICKREPVRAEKLATETPEPRQRAKLLLNRRQEIG
jgi:hypothetical protein